jgi:hypothetical protein
MNILKALQLAAFGLLLSAGALAQDATTVVQLNATGLTLLATATDQLVVGRGGVSVSVYATGTQPLTAPFGPGIPLSGDAVPINLAVGDSLYGICTNYSSKAAVPATCSVTLVPQS